ncbi:MAG: dynamin family protein [Propionibacteriaceae bacterium]|nr:dynamin family protein [Propionibacteriaceae bacterium]
MADRPLDFALARLREALANIHVPLQMPSATAAADYAKRQVSQLDDYILPRLAQENAPLLAVVGGSTGAGKSTLINSLAGRTVSPASVLRPTTRVPTLVYNLADASWFESDRVLPHLVRTKTETDDPNLLRLSPVPTLPAGMAILDAPDVDSIVAENRQLATQLMDAADLWIFLTTAVRYADAVPWDHLQQAAERDATVVIVLNRVPKSALAEVSAYLRQMLTERGLAETKLFCIPEIDQLHEGRLPDEYIQELKTWLSDLAGNLAARRLASVQTMSGAINAMSRNIPKVIDAIEEQQIKVTQLRTMSTRAYSEASSRIMENTADGTLLRGEVLAKWHDFVGTGQFFRAVEQKIGGLRDRMTAFFSGVPKQAVELGTAIESGLDVLIRHEADLAAQRASAAWEADPSGRAILAGVSSEITRGSPGLSVAAKELVTQWQEDVLKLVSETGVEKRAQARFLALGVNGVGVALMIFVFSHTGGLVGAEVGIAGGTAVLAQRVLEAVFGDSAVRKLAQEAKINLDSRIAKLLSTEQYRFDKILDELKINPDAREQLSSILLDVSSTSFVDPRLSQVS